MLRYALAALIVTFAAGCGTTGGPGSVNGGGGGLFSNEITGKASWSDRPQGRDWTQMTRTALDADGASLIAATPADIAAFCPGYAALDPQGKREFWVVLVSEIASFESGLNPDVVKTPPSTPPGSAQARRGLMQISSDAAQRYACANVGVAQLTDPQTNLGCGVKILAATSGRDQIVLGFTSDGWKGAGRYWTDLRRPEALADIQDHLNQQTFCRKRTS